jgi:hypothetical protein
MVDEDGDVVMADGDATDRINADGDVLMQDVAEASLGNSAITHGTATEMALRPQPHVVLGRRVLGTRRMWVGWGKRRLTN